MTEPQSLHPSLPRVSVVVLCYRHESYIEQCLDSVVDQQGIDLQLIVMDDASGDGSVQRIQAWQRRRAADCVLTVNPSNRGMTPTLNRAMALVDGDYVAVLGGDDWMEPGRLREQVSWLASASERHIAVSGDLRRVDEQGRPVDANMSPLPPGDLDRATVAPRPGSWDESDQFASLLRGNWVQAPSVLMRRAALEVAGPYDESLPSEDLSMWLRLNRAGYRIGYRPGVVTNYRQHRESMTSTMRPAVVEGTARLFEQFAGERDDHDRIIWSRVATFALVLHAQSYDPKRVRPHLWRALRHRPSARLAAAALENLVGARPGALARLRGRAAVDPPAAA